MIMVNSVMLVGRLASDLDVTKLESGKEVTNVSLAVPRSYKNADGIYETDFFDCTLWEGLAKNAAEYCKKGDTVGIRGRLQTDSWEKDGAKRIKVNIIVEKLTFLSARKIEEQEVADDKDKTTEKATKKSKDAR
jgi:single-strand DNA-binding protein